MLSNVILILRWELLSVPVKYLVTTRCEYGSSNIIPCGVATPVTAFLTPGRVLVIVFQVTVLLSAIGCSLWLCRILHV